MLHVGIEDVDDVARFNNQWLWASALVYLYTVVESRELHFGLKIDIGRRTTKIGEGRHGCSNVEVENERTSLPHHLPNVIMETCGWIEGEIQLFRWGQKSWIVDAVTICWKDWRLRDAGWRAKPFEFLSGHRVGLVCLHSLRLLGVGKHILQDTGVRGLAVGDIQCGIRGWF